MPIRSLAAENGLAGRDENTHEHDPVTRGVAGDQLYHPPDPRLDPRAVGRVDAGLHFDTSDSRGSCPGDALWARAPSGRRGVAPSPWARSTLARAIRDLPCARRPAGLRHV